MVKTIHTMHALAERAAINKGPRIIEINGVDKAAYYLTKDELAKLFTLNGYNTSRISWLKYILEWKRTWEEIAPNPSRILDPDDDDWSMIFIHVSDFDRGTLYQFSDKNDVAALVVS